MTKTKTKEKVRHSTREVVALWKSEVCSRDGEFEDSGWEDIWYGLVLGLGRADLATYSKYMDLGFPHEVKGE